MQLPAGRFYEPFSVSLRARAFLSARPPAAPRACSALETSIKTPFSPPILSTVERLQPPEQQCDVKQEQHGENRCQQLVKPFSPNDRSYDRREGEGQVKIPHSIDQADVR